MPACSRPLFCAACTVLVILACMIAGCSSTPAPSPAVAQSGTPGGNSITMKNFAFDPPALTVKAGTAVTWTNQDSVPHRIASDPGSLVSFASDSLPPGSSYTFTFTFTQPGSYSYTCTIHPSMKGTVLVE